MSCEVVQSSGRDITRAASRYVVQELRKNLKGFS